MKFSCKSNNLKKAISNVLRVVGNRATLPILNNILIEAQKGRIQISATDLEIGIVSKIGGKIEEEGTLSLPARLFSDFVTSCREETIEFTTNKNQVELKTETANAHLNGIDGSEFPVIPEPEIEQSITVDAQVFKKAVAQTAFAVAYDETRPVLTGVLISFKKDNVLLVATDSYRLAEKSIETKEKIKEDFELIIPARTLQEVARLITDTNSDLVISTSSNQISFVIGDTRVVSRVIEGNYPEYKKIIPETSKTELITSVSEFLDALKLASSFAKEVSNNIKLIVSPDEDMQIIASSPQVGDTNITVKSDTKGESLEISFNGKFLFDVVQGCQSDKVVLSFSGPLAPVVVKPESGDDYRALVMPLKLD